MKIPLKFVELHNPLFLNSKNHKNKISESRDTTLTYDRENRELHVTHSGPGGHAAAIIPLESVASMEPHDPDAAGITFVAPKQKPAASVAPTKPVKAQIQDPTRDVQSKR